MQVKNRFVMPSGPPFKKSQVLMSYGPRTAACALFAGGLAFQGVFAPCL